MPRFEARTVLDVFAVNLFRHL